MIGCILSSITMESLLLYLASHSVHSDCLDGFLLGFSKAKYEFITVPERHMTLCFLKAQPPMVSS